MSDITVAIGLDAADPDLVEGFVADGTMPALADLWGRGSNGRLYGPDVYRAETPWTNFLTGCRAEISGYWGPIRYNAQSYLTDEAGAYDFERLPPFYAGGVAPVCVLDVPQTRLLPALPGVQLLGWGSHSQQGPRCSSPVDLLGMIESRFGKSPVDDVTVTSAYDDEALDDFSADVLEALRRRAALSEFMIGYAPWQLFFTVIGETHSGGHELWHHGRSHPLQRAGVDRIREIYAAADRVIASVTRGAPADANIIVFSLHGMFANQLDVPSMALLPEVLARWSFGEAFIADGQYPPHLPRQDHVQHWKHEMWSLRTASGDRMLTGPSGANAKANTLSWQPAQWYRPLWPRMRAFALPSYSDGAIRFNIRGRERDGLVNPSQIPKVARELEDLLKGLMDLRTGRRAVESVLYRPARSGEFQMPADVIVQWSNAALSDVFAHPELGVFGPYPWFRTGGHRSVGFWNAVGPSLPCRQNVNGSLQDLTVTLLDLLGRSPASWMEGRSLVARA